MSEQSYEAWSDAYSAYMQGDDVDSGAVALLDAAAALLDRLQPRSTDTPVPAELYGKRLLVFLKHGKPELGHWHAGQNSFVKCGGSRLPGVVGWAELPAQKWTGE